MKLKATRLMQYGKGLRLWTPQLISADLWLDASDASTVTLNGSTVSQWSDKSGNNRHFTQAIAASQPGYSANQINGYPILTFDGSDDFLDGGNILPATNGIMTFIIARQNTIGAATSAPYIGRVSSTLASGQWQQRGMLSSQTAGVIATINIGANSYSATRTDPKDSNWYLLSVRYSSTANQLQALRSGNGSSAVPTSGTAPDPGIACRIAAKSAGTIDYLHMDIAEVIVLLNAPTFTQNPRPQIEGYLSWKYGLQGNLPATHQYKNAPPTI